MNSYEVQNLLKDKVDRHEIHQLKSDLDSLERRLRESDSIKERQQNQIQNLQECLKELVILLRDHENTQYIQEELHGLLNKIY